MYVVTKERRAWFEVEWTSLNEAGEVVTNTIRMKAELVDLEDFNAFVEVALIDRTSNGNEGAKDPIAFIQKVSSDWGDIIDEGRRPFEFNDANLLAIIRSPGFLLGWTMSYIRAWNGQGKVREKNSASSPAAGPAGAKPKPRPRSKSS